MKRLSLAAVLILFIALTCGQPRTAFGIHGRHCGGGYIAPCYDYCLDSCVITDSWCGDVWTDIEVIRPNPNNGRRPNPNNGGLGPDPINGRRPNPNPDNGGNRPDPNADVFRARGVDLNQAVAGANRAWVYDSPRRTLVLGSLAGMKSGQVHLRRQSGQVIQVPLWQLSATDQKIVVSQHGNGERTWTDDSNRYQRRAEFAGVNGGQVILKTTHGKTVTISFAKLSASDQCVVRHLHRAPIREEIPGPRSEQLVAR